MRHSIEEAGHDEWRKNFLKIILTRVKRLRRNFQRTLAALQTL